MNHKWKLFSRVVGEKKHFGFEIVLSENERVVTPVVEVDDYGDEMAALARLCLESADCRHELLEEDSSFLQNVQSAPTGAVEK
jgi:hypothetical protein